MGLFLARIFVRLTAGLVPSDHRAEWVDEWTAELWHERAFLTASGTSGPRRNFILVRAAVGAVADARALRRWRRAGRVGRSPHFSSLGIGLMLGEFRYALRALRRHPGFTATCLVTLAVGIGVTTAMFGIVHGVLIRPLPYPDADRLAVIGHAAPGLGTAGRWGLSRANYFHYRRQVPSLEMLAVYTGREMNLTGDGDAERIRVLRTTADLFPLLGAQAVLGRVLTSDDDRIDATPVVVLGHAMWVRRYGSDSSVVGTTIVLDGRAVEVVGVMAPGVELPTSNADAWSARQLDPDATPRNNHVYSSLARRRAGVDLNTLRADLNREVQRFPELFPTAYSRDFLDEARFVAAVVPLHEEVVGDVSRMLWIILASVGLVLLIACANVANLFLIRAEGRCRELALREAVGASRQDVVRFLLAESLGLSLAGGALGVLVAGLGIRWVRWLTPDGLPRLDHVGLNVPTLLFAGVIAVLTGLVFGSLPLTRRAGATVEIMRDGAGGGGAMAGPHRQVARKLLVVGQVAMALTLLVASGLMMRTFRQLRSVDPGFQPDRVVAIDVSLPSARYPTREAVHRFYSRLLIEIAALPGVERVGAATALPLESGLTCFSMFTSANTNPDRVPCVPVTFAMPGYFEAMGISIIRGRGFEPRDNEERTGAVVVNEVLAAQLWPGLDPIGRAVKIGGNREPFLRVVGVARAVHVRGLEEPAPEGAYFPMLSFEGDGYFGPFYNLTVIVRTAMTDALPLTAPIRRLVSALDPDVPISRVRTLPEVLERSLGQTAVAMALLTIAAAIALLLGTVGLYGMLSYLVNRRRAEVGIRIALGARRGDVGRMVMGESVRVVSVGLAIGLVAAAGLQRTMGALLFGVRGLDLLSLATAIGVLLGVSMAASYLPARRAARVDPMAALRAE